MRLRLKFIFLVHLSPVVAMSFIEKVILSPLNCLCTFIKNHLVVLVWFYFWTLSWIDLCVCPFTKYHTVLISVSSKFIVLKSGTVSSPIFFQNYFDYSSSFAFTWKFSSLLVKFHKHTYTKPAGIFDYDYIDYKHQFAETDLNNIESSDPWISYSSLSL